MSQNGCSSLQPVSSMHRTHEPTAQKTNQPTTQKQVTFVKDELRNRLLWEQQLHHQIHRVPDKGRHHKHKHHQKCLYRDDGGQVTQVNIYQHIQFDLPIHRCVLVLCTILLSFVKNNHRHITRVGFEPTAFATLEQCQNPT